LDGTLFQFPKNSQKVFVLICAGLIVQGLDQELSHTSMRLNMLVVDDTPETLDIVRDALATEDVQIFTAPNAEVALERYMQIRPRIILADLVLPGMNGLELLDRVLDRDPGADFILMTAYYSTESAVDAIRRGACDYLPKPLDVERLRKCIRDLVKESVTRLRTFHLDHDLLDVYQFESMIGRSPSMLEVFAKIRRIAPHFRSVLVTGATGTGKELAAKALHHLSPASTASFAVCNCSALVESLLESQLFGYVRGAFTGAVQDKQGIFEYANGGTVFLDEVGELSLSAQAKLLRVLQNNEVQRVGSPVPHQVNVRVIAATHRDLRRMVAAEQFREDLFYRLSVVEISLPSLARRKEDLPLLQRHFLEKYSKIYGKDISGITRRAQARLAAHNWPGNVRELENVISGSCIMASGSMIDLHDLPEVLRGPVRGSEPDISGFVTLEAMQEHYLMRVLEFVQGNKAKAAEILGVGRNTVYQMLRRMSDTGEYDAAAEG
jgi:DNA-binding NtrC family response regulator